MSGQFSSRLNTAARGWPETIRFGQAVSTRCWATSVATWDSWLSVRLLYRGAFAAASKGSARVCLRAARTRSRGWPGDLVRETWSRRPWEAFRTPGNPSK